MGRTSHRIVLAIWLIFSGAGGDVVRYTIGFYAWGVITALTLVWVIVTLATLRIRIFSMPVEVAAYGTFAVVSSVWAISPLSTLGVGASLIALMIGAGLVLATLNVQTLWKVMHWTLQALLVGSLLFELAVALSPADRLFPLVPVPGVTYSADSLDQVTWSRGLLFEGGRIQGLMGNSNLLAMTALLALIVAGARALESADRFWLAWVCIPVLCLVLTRSGTVLVAATAVAATAVLLAIRLRVSRATFRTVLIAAAGAFVLGAVVIATNWTMVTGLIGRDSELTGRLGIWESALGLWQSSPIVGTGYMGYWYPWVAPFDHLGFFDGVVYLQAHNVWVDHLMQLGVIGVILWIAMQWRAFRSAHRWLRIPGAASHIPFLILVALFVQGFAESRPMIEIGLVLLVAFSAGLGRRGSLMPRTVTRVHA